MPKHGIREYGQPMGRLTGDGRNIFPAGSAGAMQYEEAERVNAQIQRAVDAAQEAQEQYDRREAAEYAAQAPMALAEAEQALAEEMRRLREESGGGPI